MHDPPVAKEGIAACGSVADLTTRSKRKGEIALHHPSCLPTDPAQPHTHPQQDGVRKHGVLNLSMRIDWSTTLVPAHGNPQPLGKPKHYLAYINGAAV